MRVILDTDVVVAALCSPTGASAAIVLAALEGHIGVLANVALVLEYEAVCLRPEQLQRAGLNSSQALTFVDALIALCEPVQPHFVWRPQLNDPNDEMVLEAAVNGQAQAIVSFNHRDFGAVPARFGIELLLPRDLLRRMRNP